MEKLFGNMDWLGFDRSDLGPHLKLKRVLAVFFLAIRRPRKRIQSPLSFVSQQVAIP
jgi:hypothetical protein